MRRQTDLKKWGVLVVMTLAVHFLFWSGSCDNGGSPDPNAGLYHTYAELNDELHKLAAEFPQIVQVSSIGQSVQGRELWAIKISDHVTQDEAEAEVVFLGGHHAREWIAVDVPLLLANHLVKSYGSDTTITRRLQQSEVWIVPLVNPDGHQYSVTNDRLWRKNRRNNGDGTFGVDLNRNYSYQWGGPGSSGDTFSEIYRGPAPFSEPETRAVRDFLLRRETKALISYHNFSQLILYPWGYTSAPAPDFQLLQGLAVAMADRVRAVHGVTYTPQQSAELYLASGDTTDWLYGERGVPNFTIELRPRSVIPGFELPESEIAPTFEENLPAALFLIDWAIEQTMVTL
ncbi:MAG: M14 family metallopeptidase [candidate division KSB1 bacterium]|nr:M14 family metallopeptidase [candidate division KSB1 bacterium]